MVHIKLSEMISKNFRGSVRKKFILVWLLEVRNLILIGFILFISLYFKYLKLFIIVTILFNCFSYIDLK